MSDEQLANHPILGKMAQDRRGFIRRLLTAGALAAPVVVTFAADPTKFGFGMKGASAYHSNGRSRSRGRGRGHRGQGRGQPY